MNHIMQFAFFFNEPKGYVLKSDVVRAQLEEKLRLVIKDFWGLEPDGSMDPNKIFGYVNPADEPKDLDYSLLPSIFVSMVLRDFSSSIIRSKYYAKDLTFVFDLEITPEEFSLFNEDRFNGNTLFEHLFDRYEWTEYSIARVVVEHQKSLEDYIAKLIAESHGN